MIGERAQFSLEETIEEEMGDNQIVIGFGWNEFASVGLMEGDPRVGLRRELFAQTAQHCRADIHDVGLNLRIGRE